MHRFYDRCRNHRLLRPYPGWDHSTLAFILGTVAIPYPTKHTQGFLRLAICIAWLSASCAWCGSDSSAFIERKWGSDAQFNPVSMILNEGWDITQLQGRDNRLSYINHPDAFRRLGRTLSHPVTNVKRVGVGEFFTSEIVPSSLAPEKAQWIPNYQLHLIGGGFANMKAEEWYRENGYQNPKLLAFATSASAWILNEASEIASSGSDYSADPVADLFLFDLGGVLLFQSFAVRAFFTQRMETMNWPLQPSIDPQNGGRVLNAGQYYALKIPLPYTKDWKLFYHFGLGNIAGLTRQISAGHSVSVGAGAYASRIVRLDSNRNSAALAPKFGVFWDHDNSLWASAFYNGQSVQRFSVEIYPTPWTSWPVPLGFWGTFGGSRGMSFGAVATMGIGIGWSQ